MNKVKVTINGYDYQMVSEKSESQMLSVAKYIDQEMMELIEKNPKLSTAQAGILTSLNIADKLFECGYENEELVKEKEELLKEKEELLKKVEESGSEVKFELRKIQMNYDNLKNSVNEKDEKIKLLEEEIEKYKKEVESLNEKINSSSEFVKVSEEKIEEYKKIADESEKKAKLAERFSIKISK